MARIQSLIQHSPRLFEIQLDREWDFSPGDWTLAVSSDGCTSRPYALASAPGAPCVSLLVRRLDLDGFSTWLTGLRAGDEVELTPPAGNFRPQGGKGSVFVATGTGGAPFLSYIRGHQTPPEFFLWGLARGEDLAPLPEDLRGPWFRGTFTQEEVPGAWQGRVDRHIDRCPLGDRYYLCGHGSMVNSWRQGLITRGVAPERIFGEVYFA